MRTQIDWNSLLDVPSTKWPIHFLAYSAGATGLVNSFLAKVRGRKIYGHRKHEFIDGRFTGKQWFVVENA